MDVDEIKFEPKNKKMKKGTIALLILAMVLLLGGAAIGLTLHFTQNPGGGKVEPVARQDTVGNCLPPQVYEDYHVTDKDQTKENCEARKCHWERATSDGSPQCTFPADYGYTLDQQLSTIECTDGCTVPIKRNTAYPSMWGAESQDIDTVHVMVEMQTNNRLRIKLFDPNEARFEVPEEALKIDSPSSPPPEAERLYRVNITTSPAFGVRVYRKDTGTLIFDTAVPGLVFSDVYHQISVRLPSSNFYGLGEHNHRQLKHDMNWKKWTIFTRDMAPVDEWHLYGHQTLYMNLEDDGNANAVMLNNANAMDIMLQPDPYPGLTYHVIGGVLDFYVFLGPSPVEIVQQYTEATGRPLMPPYYMLGFQLSRWDYDNITHVRTVIDRTMDAGIPHDVQYGDIDYMERKLLFTYDKDKYAGLPELVNDVHARGQHYIIILDHALGSNSSAFAKLENGVYKPYADGLTWDDGQGGNGIFVKDPNDPSQPLKAEVWPGEAVYPDYTLGDSVKDWWKSHCLDFYNGTDWGVKYDALWIDMNEPSSFIPGSVNGCNRNKYNYPVYKPNIFMIHEDGELFDKTICMDAPGHWGQQYDTHSLYGHSMSIVNFKALEELFPNRRPFVLTRSQYMGSQKYAAHWLGDNQSEWRQIPWSIIGMIEYSLFGFSYTGADICGFWYAATEEMCLRWMQLGAFYPYARNHNAAGWPDQDPVAMGPTVTRVSRDILMTRYKLLPFLYTLLHDAHVQGDPVVQALMFQFPKDRRTLSIDKQFLWGPSFMISAVMEEQTTFLNVYFPEGRWYDYYTGEEVTPTGTWKNMSTPLDKIQLHVRGGYILPWQEPANTTVFSRRKPMGVIVALGDAPDYEAHGKLFWDDGESHETYQKGQYLQVDFDTKHFALDLTVSNNGYSEAEDLSFDTVQIWGLDRRPAVIRADDSDVSMDDINWDSSFKALTITNLGLNITSDHQIEWSMS